MIVVRSLSIVLKVKGGRLKAEGRILRLAKPHYLRTFGGFSKFDALVLSPFCLFHVIPAKAGIQGF
jgi:hypothetical protein